MSSFFDSSQVSAISVVKVIGSLGHCRAGVRVTLGAFAELSRKANRGKILSILTMSKYKRRGFLPNRGKILRGKSKDPLLVSPAIYVVCRWSVHCFSHF